MKPRIGQYFYRPCGTNFRIYRYTEVTGHNAAASPVPGEPVCFTREEAKKRVCELNGWRYEPCKTN